MSFVSTIMVTAERVPLPDAIIRAAIQRLCSRTATKLATGNAESDAWLADEMAARAITEYVDGADAQRYEVPAAFFAHVLGPNRKYSCCFYKEAASTDPLQCMMHLDLKQALALERKAAEERRAAEERDARADHERWVRLLGCQRQSGGSQVVPNGPGELGTLGQDLGVGIRWHPSHLRSPLRPID